ncbi:GH25 family lysozyme [Nonlabens sp.]|uniref:glycoside hydrolase family 25 protein n=1 Tax=Nonlabens sp. TaxID=1888209 RepID=UPI001BCBE360|nr:GH25 family lysozyme [Nonlabens sp.]
MKPKKWTIGIAIAGILLVAVAIITIERYSYHSSPRQPANTYLHQRIKKFQIQGIDISHHQGVIDWQQVRHPDTTQSFNFAFIRATVGMSKDRHFKKNWEAASQQGFSRGAYHYYWSNVNSTKQAHHFMESVSIAKGDLPPVLDIEDISTIQNKKSLRKGLKNWIQIIETHYGVQPIIYSGEAFYRDVLRSDAYFNDYPRIWIANYNGVASPRISWKFWQYTDRMPVDGIETLVDANVFNGSREEFNRLLVP